MADSRSKPFCKPRPAGSLKAAAAALVDAIGVKRAEVVTDRRRSQIYRWTEDGEAHMPLDAAAAMIRETADLAVVEFLAAEAGAVVLRVTGLAGPEALAAHVGALGADVGQTFQDYATALADGVIDAGERGQLIADLDAIVRAAMAARADLTSGAPDSDVIPLARGVEA